jgi:putative restriction endonuclease
VPALAACAGPLVVRRRPIVREMDTATDPQRPDVHNGLLLSALWDAAFDRGLISFADDGTVLASSSSARPERGADVTFHV